MTDKNLRLRNLFVAALRMLEVNREALAGINKLAGTHIEFEQALTQQKLTAARSLEAFDAVLSEEST